MKENLNADYDVSSGVFTTKEAGVYKFDLHAYTSGGYYAQLYIALNGNRYSTLHFDSTRSLANMGSASAVMHLDVDDKVTVVSQSLGSTYQLNQDIREMANSFSGVLIHSDNCLH